MSEGDKIKSDLFSIADNDMEYEIVQNAINYIKELKEECEPYKCVAVGIAKIVKRLEEKEDRRKKHESS